MKGLVLFVGKRSKTWYYQKDVGGQTRRVLIGRYPMITAEVARQTALGFALEWGRGAGKQIQIGAPTLQVAMEAYLARPKLRSDTHKLTMRQQFELHLKDWLRLPLDEITKSMVVERHRSLAATPSTANHLLKYFRTVWNHARRVHDLQESLPNLLAITLLMQGKMDEAKGFFEQANAIFPNPSSHSHLAAIAALRNDTAEADLHVRKALEIYPAGSVAGSARYWAYIRDQAYLARYLDALRAAGYPENPR